MPVPDTPKMDETLDAIIMLCEVQMRQIVAIANICKALRSDGPKTFQLPDPPKELMQQIADLVRCPSAWRKTTHGVAARPDQQALASIRQHR